MKLALGTVQFGLAYGFAGSGLAVPEPEVRRIAAAAAARGVDCLDTAAGYGDIEQRIAHLAPQAEFTFVSKIPALPAGLDASAAGDFVRLHIDQSRRRLGPRLRGLMFHRQDDLAGALAAPLWAAAAAMLEGSDIELGVSCYEPKTLRALALRFPVALAQLPGNAFDQRVTALAGAAPKVHLRSAFLQGLLLQRPDLVVQRLPGATAAVEHWVDWCRARGLPPLQAALGIVKGLGVTVGARITHCVVGVESAAQFEQVAGAWDDAKPIQAPELACPDLGIIDPRRWTAPATTQ